MNEAIYRSQMIWDVLKKTSRKRFDSVVDFGCGDGSILRPIMYKVGAKRAKGIDLKVSEVLSDSLVLHRGNFLEYEPVEQYQLVISNQTLSCVRPPESWNRRFSGWRMF